MIQPIKRGMTTTNGDRDEKRLRFRSRSSRRNDNNQGFSFWSHLEREGNQRLLRFRLPYLPLLLGVGARAIDETTENKETRTTGVGFGKRWVDGQPGGPRDDVTNRKSGNKQRRQIAKTRRRSGARPNVPKSCVSEPLRHSSAL